MMTSIKEVHQHHLLHILVVVVLFLLCIETRSIVLAGDANTVVVRCIDREREALLEFKRGLVDKSGRLSSWGSEEDKRECCQWRGVYCNNHTGHVIYLNLSSSDIAGKISPSLLELRNLNYLDLSGSGNDFGGMPIPKFIGSLTKLVHLDLSSANFGGTIPYQLGNLSNLHHLDLSFNYGFESNPFPEFIGSLSKLVHLDLWSANFSGIIPQQLGNLSNLDHLDLSGNNMMYVKNLEWVSRLSSLTYLDLGRVDLSRANGWVDIIKTLPFLSNLYLVYCNLSRVMSPSLSTFINSSTSIATVDLSNNDLNFSTGHWLLNLSSSLVHLDFRGNLIKVPIPDEFGYLTSLTYLNLRYGQLVGVVPKSFGNLSKLEFLYLSDNSLTGSLLDFRGYPSLKSLDLSYNQFSGPLPDLRGYPSLKSLDLSHNQFSEPLPDFRGYPSLKSFGSLSKLEYLGLSHNSLTGSLLDFRGYPSLKSLDLSHNQFSGPLPETYGQLSELAYLDMSNNSLKGVISEGHLSNLFNLTVLRLSFTGLTFNLSSQWVSPFQLEALHLRSCKLGPRFPNWIRTQKKLSMLDLSSNGISDSVPTWFWDLSTGLQQLNLSSNNIRGILPNLTSIFSMNPGIDLSSNNLEGPIPRFLSKASSLNLSKNNFSGALSFLRGTAAGRLLFLDVSHNLLFGEIPDCWMHFKGLVILNFGYNNFSGEIPISLGFLSQLESLVLRKNNLSGKMPMSLGNCTRLTFLDVGENNLSGYIPPWIGENISQLSALILRSNKFYGSIPLHLCHLWNLQLLDLSINNISGTVPQCFSNFTAMIRKETQYEIFTHQYPISFDSHIYYAAPAYGDNALVATKGGEYDYGRNLRFMKSIDLSSNKLSGEFPRTITALLGLNSFNISNNDIYGNIPPQIGNLKSLESLDLSNNRISDGILTSMSYLTFLSYLDLSNNNLSGKIPLGTQLQGFPSSKYSGNEELCGTPLPRKCHGDESSQDPSISGGNKNSEEGIYEFDRGFCIGAALGFSTTFWGICGVLLLNRRWRHAYFLYLKNLKDWIYVTVAVSITKFRRMF